MSGEHNHASTENKLFKKLDREGAAWHASNAVAKEGPDSDHLRTGFLNDYDEECRRYETELGSEIASQNIPEMYSCKRASYEHMVLVDSGKTYSDGAKKVVLASCYWDPWWYEDSNSSANIAFFILSAIADAATSSRKTEAYQYAHLLCLEADATRDPQGEGFQALKKIATTTKDVHGKIFTSVWAYIDSRRFHKDSDMYQMPRTYPYTTPLCEYRPGDISQDEEEGMVFANSMFLAGKDVTFFEAKGDLQRTAKAPSGYERSSAQDDGYTNWNELWVKTGTNEVLPYDADTQLLPPLNNEELVKAASDREEGVLTESHLDIDVSTTRLDDGWKTYWTNVDEDEDDEEFSVGSTKYKYSKMADGTDELQKKRYRADACFNAFKDEKAASRALQPIQWSQGYNAVPKAEFALLYLEARARSARGLSALSTINKHAKNNDGQGAISKTGPTREQAARFWAEHAQGWLKEECIEFDEKVCSNHHEEPIMCGGKVLVVWRYGKEGPYPTMIEDVFSHKGTKRSASAAEGDANDNYDLNQAQRGHFMMLGKFPGVVDNSASGREAAMKFGETFWIMNHDPPSGMVSRWVPNGKGGVENVWLSDAKDAKVEAERAYAADRPPYFLNAHLDKARSIPQNDTEFVSEVRKEQKSAYKMPPLQVWVKDDHGVPVEKDSIPFKESGNYYPSVINPASRIPNPTVIASVAPAAAAAESGDYSDDYSGDYSDDYNDYSDDYSDASY